MDGQFCLKWDGFQSSVTSLFDHLRRDQELVDITLCCEGQQIRAHRMMLSACSPYFRDLLKGNPCQQMVIFLKDTSASDLRAIVEFMYKGSVNVAQSQLASFIKTAEMLQIRGLSGEEDKAPPSPAAASSPAMECGAPPPPPERGPPAAASPPAKRRRPSPPAEEEERSAGSPGRRPDTPPPSSDQSPPSPAVSPGPAGPTAGPTAGPAAEPAAGPAAQTPAEPAPAAVSGLPAPAAAAQYVKVEKVDLTEEDEGSLDAALGRLSDYEGVYSLPPGNSHHTAANAAALPGACPLPPPAGPSQRTSDDTSTPGRLMSVCRVCGRQYSNRQALTHHMKMHQGLTTCHLCGKVLCIVAHLRRHLQTAHNMAPEAVRQMVPTVTKGRTRSLQETSGMWSQQELGVVPVPEFRGAMPTRGSGVIAVREAGRVMSPRESEVMPVHESGAMPAQEPRRTAPLDESEGVIPVQESGVIPLQARRMHE